MKIKSKITLLFTVLVTAIILILNLAVYYLTAHDVKDVFIKRLKGRANNNAQIYEYLGDSSFSVLRRIDAGSLAILPNKSVAIFDNGGKLIYHNRGENADSLVIPISYLKSLRKTGEMSFNVNERDGLGLYYRSTKPFFIFMAAENVDGRLRLAELRKLLTLSLLAAMLVTLVVGYIFSSQLVRPIQQVIGNVNAISSHNLSKRLPRGKSQDELDELTKTFNELLDRLQESFSTQRRFISNASHELSTPLTSILSQLQVTFQKERSNAEYKEILHSIQEDVEQMRQLTKSLLEIAKAGSHGSFELEELRADELVMKVIADLKRANANYDVEFIFDELPENESQCKVFGNADLLYSAIKNVIENGCKYSPDHVSRVKLHFLERSIEVLVHNKGDVITESEQDQIFHPFYRGENAAVSEGFGLGLPLAKRIIGLHKGEISFISNKQGTTFRIKLPTASSHKKS